MDFCQLDQYLREYTEIEHYYKKYYIAKQSPETLESFIETVDHDYIREKAIIIPEIEKNFGFFSFTEKLLFPTKHDRNIITLKHNRYTPAFLHNHDFFEMSYIYSGSMTQVISGDTVVLNEGDLYILPPGVEHSIGIFDDTVLINFIIRKSTFKDTFLEVLGDENILSAFFTKILFTQSYNNYIIFRTNNNPTIRKALCEIMIEDIENRKYCSKILDNLIMVFFSYLLREESVKVELPQELQKNNKELTAILSYIQGNYKTVTLEELSRRFNFSVPYLSKLIKNNTGQNFREMIQAIKLNKAIELLTCSNLKIYDISKAIGYENDTHFMRTFKKVYGITPKQYRQQHSSENT